MPKGTPADIIDTLNKAASEELADPGLGRRFADLALDIPPRERQTPQPLGALQRAEAEKVPIPPRGLRLEGSRSAHMNIQSPLHMDNAAFLQWVQGRERRYELAGGRVMMMTGGTAWHGQIVGNLFEMLRARLDRRQWIVFSDFGIDVWPGTVRYPDIVVDQRGIRGDALTARVPVLVAEVLSPSTVKVDLGDKAAEYQQLSSLMTYLVFAQDEIKAWAYNRTGDAHFTGPRMFIGADASISIPALKIDLPLIEIYDGIEFN